MNKEPGALDLSEDEDQQANVDARLAAEKNATGIQDMRRASRAGRSQAIGFKVTPFKRQQLQAVSMHNNLQQVEVIEYGVDLAEVCLRHRAQLEKIAAEQSMSTVQVIEMAIDALAAGLMKTGRVRDGVAEENGEK
jgi:hypothetical protein